MTTGVDDAPIVVNGIPEGMAPTVDEDGLVMALLLTGERYAAGKLVSKPPAGYYERWSWQSVTAQLAGILGQKGKRKL